MWKALQGSRFQSWKEKPGSLFWRFGSKNSTYVKNSGYETRNRKVSKSWIAGSRMVDNPSKDGMMIPKFEKNQENKVH